MRGIYGRALAQHDVMRRWALEQRRRVRLERKGQFSLFDALGDQPNPLNSAPDLSKVKADEVYQPEPPHEPYALP